MTNVARQLQHSPISPAPASVERGIDEAFATLEDAADSPARALQARVIAYAYANEPHVEKYPGWARVAILLSGIGLSWGIVGLAVLPLLR